MKKLFLALVCFAGVAFFASCGGGTETDKEPTVNIKADKAAIVDGEEITFTIKANSNVNTKKELTKLHFILSEGEEAFWDTTFVSNGVTEIEKEITLAAEYGIDEATEIEAEVFVYDAADRYAVATTYFTVSPAEKELVETPFTWNRRGINVTTPDVLSQFGLEWKGNYQKAIYATITPAVGVTMYEFNSSVYSDITTESEKIAAFVENATQISQWKEFNVAGATSQNFNKVIGTKTADGKYHIIHITRGTYESGSFGVDATITGTAK